MTIALGVLASNGVVLAADTEMSWGDARKTEGSKIVVIENAGLAIAGAGDGGFIDALSQELQHTIVRSTSDKISDIGRAIQANLVRFYREHILPWNDPQLDVSLLIALERGERRVLWVTHKTTLRPSVCAAIGMGSAEADSLLVQLFGLTKTPYIDIAVAQATAAYIAYVVKDRVPGCGKNTDIVRLWQGKAEQLSKATVGLFERQAESLLTLQTRAAAFALGCVKTNDEKKTADQLAHFFLLVRTEFEDLAHVRLDSASFTLGESDATTISGQSLIADLGSTTPSTPRRRTKKKAG